MASILKVESIQNPNAVSPSIDIDSSGNMTFTGTVTKSGGTANGVLYLNGSGVETSGSALQFDGTNLGIGTSSPSYNLSIVSSGSTATISLKDSGTADSGRIRIRSQSESLQFITGAGVSATLDSSGNLLVGGSSTRSSAKLDVLGNVIAVGANATYYGTVSYSAGTGLLSIAAESGGGINFLSGATERARITSGGGFCIGTTSPLISAERNRLSVDSGSGTFVAGSFKNDGGNSAQTGEFWNAATIGNNVFISFITEASPTERGGITYNRAGGLVAYNTTSDYRAKDITGPIEDAGNTIDALKVYSGKMKGATIERPMLIAHEAQEVTPYAVTGEKDAVNEDDTPKYQQMDHSSLVPLLIAEIQSLRARVAALEAK